MFLALQKNFRLSDSNGTLIRKEREIYIKIYTNKLFGAKIQLWPLIIGLYLFVILKIDLNVGFLMLKL